MRAATTSPLLRVRKTTKTFPGVQALKEVDFTLLPGEIHVLLGENGAGKSTLMKIVAGVYSPDEGQIEVKNEPLLRFDPHHSRERGIATVFQELSLIPDLTVEENMTLGREPTRRLGRLDFRKRRAKARHYLEIVEAESFLEKRVRQLSVAQQQMVEIAKALSLEPDIIIMDEPTSKLFGNETQILFRLVRQIRDAGKGVIWITHRLEEVPVLADRVTVLRDGENVITSDSDKISSDQLIRRMVGRDLQDLHHRQAHERGGEVLRLENLNIAGKIQDVSLALFAGEVVGLTGIVGAGRTELAEALMGIRPKVSGTIYVNGEEVSVHDPVSAKGLGIALIPEDRREEGLVLTMTVRDNLILNSLDGFVLPQQRLDRLAKESVERLDIRTPSIHTLVRHLSGGNQQKVAIAKWLNSKAKVFILDEPTQGIDVGAKLQIYELLDAMASEGAAILLISSDMKEVLGVCDRVLVMCKGKLSGEFLREEATQEKILRSALVGVQGNDEEI